MFTWGGSLNTKMSKRNSIQGSLLQMNFIRPLHDRKVKMIACGDFHTLVLEESGQVWSWGGAKTTQHNRGQCGLGEQ